MTPKAMTGEATTRSIKIPGPDHPITIARNPARIVVSLAGRVIADTRAALTLREAAWPLALGIGLAQLVMVAVSVRKGLGS